MASTCLVSSSLVGAVSNDEAMSGQRRQGLGPDAIDFQKAQNAIRYLSSLSVPETGTGTSAPARWEPTNAAMGTSEPTGGEPTGTHLLLFTA